MVLDELQRRNYAPITIKQYPRIIDEFAGYFGRPIEKLGPNHIRAYQAHLLRDRKLASRAVRQHVAALRFVFVKTPKRAYMLDYIPFPKEEQGLPIVLSQEEVARLCNRQTSRRLTRIMRGALLRIMMRAPACVALLKPPCSDICRAHRMMRPTDSRPVPVSHW
jgi:site-specific recombinase XerD